MQRIFLTGLSGSGKTSVGRHVSKLLRWDFIDTDTLLSERYGMPIGQILTEFGEQRFRQMESEALILAAQNERVVIATGGGAVISEANRTFMRENGLTIYLDTSLEIAWQRVQKQIPKRVIAYTLTHGYLNASSRVQETITLRLGKVTSNAVIEWGGLSHLPESLKSLGFSQRIFIVTDSDVGYLYSKPILSLLGNAGFVPQIFTVPAGEASKSIWSWQQILNWLVEQKAEQREPIIALGGGVIGDLAGFVAATYHRGIPLVQIPTSLLAQVDSAIGGKTGINHPLGKNLIGAFYQPGLIIVEPAFLLTLQKRVYLEGLAEIVKYGMILDANLFEMLEVHASSLLAKDSTLLTKIITRCIQLKMDVVQRDERDGGLRNLLNYGHTFGHALEVLTDYGSWLHGEAVAVGMEVAAQIAVARGLLSNEHALRQRELLLALHLPLRCPGIDAVSLIEKMQRDKKVRTGQMRWILPTQIGQADIYDDVPLPLIQDAVASVCS